MKLDCVLTACNMNPLYSDFIPIFIKTWNKLYPNVDVKIVLIHEFIPPELDAYTNNIILFKPIANISTAFISQYIRLLYPCILNYTNGIMITDMDMIPMNSTYYTKNIENIDDSKFIYYRNVLLKDHKEIAMCYNVGLSKTWSEIFNIKSIEDINVRLKEVNNNIKYVDGHGASGWATDQIDFFKYVVKWNESSHNFVYLNDMHTGYKRLDRAAFFNINSQLRELISNGYFSDYHAYRPYSQYKSINDEIYELLPVKNETTQHKIK